MINAILVDDHELFRTGIRLFIESKHPDIRILAEVESGEDFFGLPCLAEADIVLLDIDLPDMNGIEVARKLRREYPEIKILVISAENNIETINEMLDTGIQGFITKRKGGSEVMVDAIRSIISGHEYFGKDIAEIMYRIYLSKQQTEKTAAQFTQQEHEVIALCAEGLPAKQIADRLFISNRTVERHKQNIFEKLGIHSTVEMVQYAVKNGIIK